MSPEIINSGNEILKKFMTDKRDVVNYHSDWNELMKVWIALPSAKDYVINSILSGDIEKAWGSIVGYINKYIV